MHIYILRFNFSLQTCSYFLLHRFWLLPLLVGDSILIFSSSRFFFLAHFFSQNDYCRSSYRIGSTLRRQNDFMPGTIGGNPAKFCVMWPITHKEKHTKTNGQMGLMSWRIIRISGIRYEGKCFHFSLTH